MASKSEGFIQYENMCRTCLATSNIGILTDIFDIVINEQRLTEVLLDFAGIKVMGSDDMPHHICENCITELMRVLTFKNKCESTQQYLNSSYCLLDSDQLKNDDVKFDLCSEEIKIVKTDTSDVLENYSNDYSHKSFETKEKLIAEEINRNESMSIGIKTSLTESNGSYICNQCNSGFDSLKKFEEHQKTATHTKVKTHRCDLCEKRCSSKDNLRRHLLIHTEEKHFICGTCGKSFRTIANLRLHEHLHTGKRPHVCDVCGKGFIQTRSLIEHRAKHTGEALYSCNYCDKTFMYQSQIGWHKLTHRINEHITTETTNKNYTDGMCKPCNKVFSSRTAWMSHLVRHGKRMFLCSYCGKSFHTKFGLKIHLNSHTGDRPYVCQTCGKGFTQLSGLQRHTYIHTGEKPFMCTICGRAFKQQSHLIYHTRLHTGENPYKCNVCNKEFRQSGVFKIHMRIHTGETPFICDICNKKFYDAGRLKKHKRIHLTTK